MFKNVQLLKNIISNVPHDIFWKDGNGRFLGCNHHFAQAAGFNSPNELVGKTDYDMPWREQAEKYIQDDLEVIRTRKEKLGIEDVQTQADGKVIVALVSKVPLIDEVGNVFGVLGIYTDITDRKMAEQE